MGSTGFFYSNPRILESLTICRCHYKDSTFFSVILIQKDTKWSSGLGSNPRCPAKLTCALPTGLTMRRLTFALLKQLVCIERFSYDLEMKTREQNRNNKRTEIERFDWCIERIQTHLAFGWLSERSGKQTS